MILMPIAKARCSVLMSVYLHEKPEYLAAALKSLMDQTLPHDELVLVEDGPISPEMERVIESHREALNIISVPLAANVGLARALNAGLDKCQNELVVRMDADDLALPDRIERQVAYMISNPEVAASSGRIEEFNEDGRPSSYRVLPAQHEDLVRLAKRRSPLSHPAVILRKSIIKSVGGYQDIYPEDYMLWVIMIKRGYRLGNLKETVLRMRVNDAILKRRGLKMLKGELKIHAYMYRNKMLGRFEFLSIVMLKILHRLAPGFLKILFYKVARG